MLAPAERQALAAVLERSQALGLLGPGATATHIEHACSLARALGRVPRRFLDLGSGAGVPGLVLALAWPDAAVTLLEARQRAADELQRAVAELGLVSRVGVELGRAEELARRGDLRGRYDLVVARGFGSPAVTAECGVGFLERGGELLVTEPPGDPDPDRWPALGLQELGLAPPRQIRFGDAGAVVLTAIEPVADRWPRRSGIPRKRPVWSDPGPE